MTALLFKSKTLAISLRRSTPSLPLPLPLPLPLLLTTATRLNSARAMSSTQRVFQLKLDPLTGNSEWLVIDDSEKEEEEKDDASKHLLATTSYLDMLNDTRRNRAFREAIEKTVTKPCHVLDIGAGTGLLSMMAARAMMMGSSGASSSMTSPNAKGMITACESYLPMVKLMRKVLHINRMGCDINVINKRSDDLEVGVDIPFHADVLVSEILDSELLGEGLLPTLQHAHDNLLVENPLSVPFRAVTYGQLVESASLWKLHDLYGNEAKAADGIHLVPTGFDTVLRVKQQQHPMHCDAISKELKLLSEPFKIFEFDFWKRPECHGKRKIIIKTSDDGRVHAVVSWWILQLDREGTISYSTAPKWIDSSVHSSIGDWCDHWKQCVWFIPEKGMPVTKGQEVALHAYHSDTRVSYQFGTLAPEVQKNVSTSDDFHIVLPPERIAIYGDSDWRSLMIKALRNALQGKVNPLCLVADDSVFLTVLAAHLSKTSHVISLLPGLRERGAQYVQAVASANGFRPDRVEVFERQKYLNVSDIDQKIDLFIGEPYYYGNDGMLPWQNLRFWKERTVLNSLLSEDAIIMPYKAILRVCAMSLPDLWYSRCSLKKVEGFDHSVVNRVLGACGDLLAPEEGPLLPFFIWQCGNHKELSVMSTIMEFDISNPMSSCYGKVQVELTESGTCHGFALWLDWVMDAKSSVVLSSGPDQRCWKQGVKLLAQPVTVGPPGSKSGICSSILIEASFDPSSGKLTVNHVFV